MFSVHELYQLFSVIDTISCTTTGMELRRSNCFTLNLLPAFFVVLWVSRESECASLEISMDDRLAHLMSPHCRIVVGRSSTDPFEIRACFLGVCRLLCVPFLAISPGAFSVNERIHGLSKTNVPWKQNFYTSSSRFWDSSLVSRKVVTNPGACCSKIFHIRWPLQNRLRRIILLWRLLLI